MIYATILILDTGYPIEEIFVLEGYPKPKYGGCRVVDSFKKKFPSMWKLHHYIKVQNEHPYLLLEVEKVEYIQ